MKTPVIDSLEHISVFGNAGSSPTLAKISGDSFEKNCEALDQLENLLESLQMDEKTLYKFLDIGADIFSSGTESGFRRGFRVGVFLLEGR